MIHGTRLSKAGLPAISGPTALVARFAYGYNQDYEHCQDAENVRKVEAVLRQLTGQDWTLRVERSSKTDGPAVPMAAPQADGGVDDTRTQSLQTPLLAKVVEVLSASILRVDPGFGLDTPPEETR